MGHRRRYPLSAPEDLENRVVMSLGSLSSMLGLLPASIHHRLTTAHVGSSSAIGAVGDSLTDLYQGYPPDRSLARNWVEQLASSRHASFGAFSKNVHGQLDRSSRPISDVSRTRVSS